MMNRQPDRELAGHCPVDTMPAMRRDVDKIAGLQAVCRGFVGETQPGFTLYQLHPFPISLVVPVDLRAVLAGGNDALDVQTWPFEEFRKLLVC